MPRRFRHRAIAGLDKLEQIDIGYTPSWRLDYNHRCIHSALDYQTPAAFAGRVCYSASVYGLRSAVHAIP